MSVEREREGDVGDVVCLWREREREGGRVMWEM